MAQVAAAKPTSSPGVNGGKFQDKDKPMEVRMSNITAAKGTFTFYTCQNYERSRHLIIIFIIFFYINK